MFKGLHSHLDSPYNIQLVIFILLSGWEGMDSYFKISYLTHTYRKCNEKGILNQKINLEAIGH